MLTDQITQCTSSLNHCLVCNTTIKIFLICCFHYVVISGHHHVTVLITIILILVQDTNKRQSIHMNDTPRGSWASSIFDLKQSQADTLLPNLFDRISYDDVDRNNDNLRQQNRYDNIFSLYPPLDEVCCLFISSFMLCLCTCLCGFYGESQGHVSSFLDY